jgi:hypothetical protein
MGIGAENIDKEKKVYISFYFKTTLSLIKD